MKTAAKSPCEARESESATTQMRVINLEQPVDVYGRGLGPDSLDIGERDHLSGTDLAVENEVTNAHIQCPFLDPYMVMGNLPAVHPTKQHVIGRDLFFWVL